MEKAQRTMRPTAAPTRASMGSLRLSIRVPFYYEHYHRGVTMPEATKVGAGKTILVVDDHDSTRQTISRMLEAGGFTVRTATNGVEALDRLAKESDEIDIVLSD